MPCAPSPSLIQSDVFVRGAAQPLSSDAFSWEPVLPPERFQARWYVPVTTALVYLILQFGIGIALAFIRQQRRIIPPLDVSVGSPT